MDKDKIEKSKKKIEEILGGSVSYEDKGKSRVFTREIKINQKEKNKPVEITWEEVSSPRLEDNGSSEKIDWEKRARAEKMEIEKKREETEKRWKKQREKADQTFFTSSRKWAEDGVEFEEELTIKGDFHQGKEEVSSPRIVEITEEARQIETQPKPNFLLPPKGK